MTRPLRRTLGGAALSALALATAAPAAHAHAVAGARVFVNTLLIDDPGVGDEASLAAFLGHEPGWQKHGHRPQF